MSEARQVIEAEDPKSVFWRAQDLVTFERLKEVLGPQGWTPCESEKIRGMEITRGKCRYLVSPTASGKASIAFYRDYGKGLVFSECFQCSNMRYLLNHLRLFCVVEAEDPKSVLRQASTAPAPPEDLLAQAIQAASERHGKKCVSTSVVTNPRGETYCFGQFGRSLKGIVVTLLFYDRSVRQWTPVDRGTFSEAEDPKSILRIGGGTIKGLLLASGFEETVGMPLHKEYVRVAGTLGKWHCEVEKSGDGTEYWSLKLVRKDGSVVGEEHTGYNFPGLRHTLRYLCLSEGEDPKSVLQAISAKSAPNPHNGKMVSGQLLRRLASGYPVVGVYIWHNAGGFPNNEGILQINFRNYGLIRQEWASFGVLAGSLLRWRNLEGAPLWVNGKPEGNVTRDHEVLRHIDSSNWRPGVVAEARKKKKSVEPKKPVTEDPKAFFQRMISTGKAAALGKSAAYAELLQYAPREFVRAFQQKQEADWEMDDFMFDDTWPSYDDDLADEEGENANPWREYSYYFNYRTEGGNIYIVPMLVDSDGDHDGCGEEAEIGTPEAARVLKEYGTEGHDQAMLSYWEWVVEHERDPLGYVNNPQPRHDIKKSFIAGFVRDGERLKLWGIRNASSPPSPPPVLWPEVWQKAQEDADFKSMMDWLLVDQNGYTEATEEQIVNEGGKWDQQNRLIVKWSWEVREEVEIQRQHLVQVAQQAIREIQQRQR